MKAKVFGVGLSKTGTASLHEALIILGYSSVHYPMDLSVLDNVDAGTDITVATEYKLLDQKYPNSKFVLTTRNWWKWILSLRKHFQRFSVETREQAVLDIRKRTYGTIYYEPIKMLIRYFKHNKEVRNYFSGRQNDILVMDITSGDGWKKLCSFLGKKVPDVPFPRTNTAFEHKQNVN